jgi:excisionase family DNA binding protein
MMQIVRQHQQGSPISGSLNTPLGGESQLLTFKEAMRFLRVSRSTLYRLMWSGQLCGHKVGSTWRFYQEELQACVRATATQPTGQTTDLSCNDSQTQTLVAAQ